MTASDVFHIAGIYTLAITFMAWAMTADEGAWPPAVTAFLTLGVMFLCIGFFAALLENFRRWRRRRGGGDYV